MNDDEPKLPIAENRAHDAQGLPIAKTLDEYVFSLFDARKTDSSEFKAILNVYGREKMLKIWERYKAKKAEATVK